MLPAAPDGWRSIDQDIATTPEEQAQVESVLHYDDAVCRIYTNGPTQVQVYIAHWLPGKFSPAKVGSHSPDTCWVHNGWEQFERNQGVQRDLAGGTLLPMETGTYKKDGQSVHVIFWHLVGGVPMSYDLVGWENGLAGRIERLPVLVEDFKRFGLDQRKEQLVIRLSSANSFDDLWTDPGFVKFLNQFSRTFGLYAKLPPPTGGSVRTAAGPGQPDEMRAL